jgi:hypothetical protein
MSKEDVILRAGVEAMIDALGPRRGHRFLRGMAARMAEAERLAAVPRLHPPLEQPSAEDRRAAAKWFSENLADFMARLE